MPNKVPVVEGEALDKIISREKDPKHMSLQSLMLLILADRMTAVEKDGRKELSELKDRQQKVSFLNKLTKAINAATTPKGEFDITEYPQMTEMLKEAKKLGVDLDETQQKYTEDERERLVENIRLTIGDFNMQNEMQLQLVTRLNSERYEVYQLARVTVKTLHEAIQTHNRGINGK
jgi:hypothetical protein